MHWEQNRKKRDGSQLQIFFSNLVSSLESLSCMHISTAIKVIHSMEQQQEKSSKNLHNKHDKRFFSLSLEEGLVTLSPDSRLQLAGAGEPKKESVHYTTIAFVYDIMKFRRLRIYPPLLLRRRPRSRRSAGRKTSLATATATAASEARFSPSFVLSLWKGGKHGRDPAGLFLLLLRDGLEEKEKKWPLHAASKPKTPRRRRRSRLLCV